jgi:hypothetical protein
MWPEVTLLLREFARRPTIDRPERADPGLDFFSGKCVALLEQILGPMFAPKGPPSRDYSARAR